MKNLVLLLGIFFLSAMAFSQPSPEPLEGGFLDEEPYFPGGMKKMNEYVMKNMRYPKDALEKEIQGRVHIKFVIEKDGSLTNVTILKGIPDCQECDLETKRLVSEMPNWIPGKLKGKIERAYYTIPVNFRIN